MDASNTQDINVLMTSTLDGSVERISYFNQETGQCILEIKDRNSEENYFVTSQVPWVFPGMQMTGKLESHVSHNNLWRAVDLSFSAPLSERNLKKFLKSEALPGFGPKLIKLVAKAFPDNLFEVLDKYPDELLGVAGIGKKKRDQIIEAWTLFKARTEFQTFLFKEHLPLSWFQVLWPYHGVNSLNLFKTNPYEIGGRYHLPFDLIDGFALRNGFSLDSVLRLRFGFKHVLWNFYKQGHCAYPEEKVLHEAMELLETSREEIEEILEIEILNDEIITETIRGTPCLYFKDVWELEKNVARKLLDFQSKEPPWGWFNSHKVLGWAQEILNIKLAPLQKEAIETSLSSAMTVITGGPGTGKTTLIKSLVTILQTQYLRFALCSPTGRAAQRLGEATHMPAQTIHRLLKYDTATGKFIHNKSNLLNFDLVLVDEASMVDLTLMSDLLDALPERCALILVGDADQIPSVGAGTILHSIISSSLFQVVRLTEIYRQSENSLIKENARRINAGQMPLSDKNKDFQYISVKDSSEAKSIVHHLVEHVIPEKCGIHNIEEIQILVPMNQGLLGAQTLNEEIQKHIGAQFNRESDIPTLGDFGPNFKVGDKVMVLKNDYKKDVFNGDIGFVERISHQEQYLEINFLGRPVRFDFFEIDRLTLAYAISIHKSQGSEYRVVVVVLTEEHQSLAQRHLIYTAVTRGKEYVFLVAEPSALQKALLDVESRWENLTQLLQPPKLSKDTYENLGTLVAN